MAFNWRRFLCILVVTVSIGVGVDLLISGDWYRAAREGVRGGLEWAILLYWIHAIITRELNRPKFASKVHQADGTLPPRTASQKVGKSP